MKATTETPKVPGWYWKSWDGKDWSWIPTELKLLNDHMCIFSELECDWIPLRDTVMCHWIGPIPEPKNGEWKEECDE